MEGVGGRTREKEEIRGTQTAASLEAAKSGSRGNHGHRPNAMGGLRVGFLNGLKQPRPKTINLVSGITQKRSAEAPSTETLGKKKKPNERMGPSGEQFSSPNTTQKCRAIWDRTKPLSLSDETSGGQIWRSGSLTSSEAVRNARKTKQQGTRPMGFHPLWNSPMPQGSPLRWTSLPSCHCQKTVTNCGWLLTDSQRWHISFCYQRTGKLPPIWQ